jgi:branched-chain amino acid transport system permease protein
MSSLVRGPGYYRRSYGEDLRLLDTRLRRVSLAAFAALVLAFPLFGSGQYVDLLNQSMIAVIGALGLSVLTGYAGQLSLGHAGLFCLSGFVTGIVATQWDVPFPLPILTAMAAGAVVGFVLGLPAVRLRGLYLVLATVAFHFIAIYAASHYQSTRTGLLALTGLTLPDPSLGPLEVHSVTDWYYALVVVVALVLVYTVNLLRTRPGRAYVAVRDRDIVAAALGVNVTRYKLSAFVVSSVLAALAGSLLVYYNGAVTAEAYSLNLAIAYLVMVVVGGLGSTAGAVLGALFVTMSLRILTFVLESLGATSSFQTDYLIPLQTLLFGVLVVGFLLFEPHGLIGLWNRARAYVELWPLRHRPLAERRR